MQTRTLAAFAFSAFATACSGGDAPVVAPVANDTTSDELRTFDGAKCVDAHGDGDRRLEIDVAGKRMRVPGDGADSEVTPKLTEITIKATPPSNDDLAGPGHHSFAGHTGKTYWRISYPDAHVKRGAGSFLVAVATGPYRASLGDRAPDYLDILDYRCAW